VQATGYDFAPPLLSDLRVPATGTVGEPVKFEVSAFDVFPFMTSWAFGDGDSGAGNTVSHVYAAPGAYPVTVTAVDGGGNTTTRIGAIGIVAKPPAPPLALALRIESESLRKLRRTGTLSVTAGVNKAASVALKGRAKLRIHRGRGRARTKLVQVFIPKTVRLDEAGERPVTLTKRGRNALKSLSQVRILVAGKARDDAGGTAGQTAALTLR